MQEILGSRFDLRISGQSCCLVCPWCYGLPTWTLRVISRWGHVGTFELISPCERQGPEVLSGQTDSPPMTCWCLGSLSIALTIIISPLETESGTTFRHFSPLSFFPPTHSCINKSSLLSYYRLSAVESESVWSTTVHQKCLLALRAEWHPDSPLVAWIWSLCSLPGTGPLVPRVY